MISLKTSEQKETFMVLFNTFSVITYFLVFIITVFAGNLSPIYNKTDLTEPDFITIENELNKLIEGFNGDVGIYVKHLPSGREIEIQADTIFPTASMVKVPIMAQIFNLMQIDSLHYDSTYVYEDRLYYEGEDVVASFKAGERISLHKLLFLSISFSDNTASLWLQELSGSGTKVNEFMSELGLEHTRVNSRTNGRQEDFRKYGWGQTTPREMALLVEKIYKGEVVGPEASDEMFRLMSKSLWDKRALSSIPKQINVASKQGSVNRSRSEVFLVNAPDNDYVVSVITKNQVDQSWNYDNEGYILLRNVSQLLWSHIGKRD
jgi:beta-lactamase class A